jgi:phytoene dehydrogenase-like protein
MEKSNVIIVGGGLAGLTAACFLAREGRQVILYEKSRVAGGRAITEDRNGYLFNLGPHALYKKGEAARILGELGVCYSGRSPSASGGYTIYQDRLYTLPAGLVSMLMTGMFTLAEKLEAARFLAGLPGLDPRPFMRLTVREWLDRQLHREMVRQFVETFFRVSTYTNDPMVQSAGAAIEQLQLAVSGNVLYLDGGWRTLVDGLQKKAVSAGVRIVTGERVVSVLENGRARGVRLADGVEVQASAVILAVSPGDAAAMLENPAATSWAKKASPIRAACLDLALKRLPQHLTRAAFGVDRPLYFSVHSASARLAPEGGALIHAAKYLERGPVDAQAVEAELEEMLDLVQPGWRAEVVEKRFLPQMTVSQTLVSAEDGGPAGRPGPAVPGVDGLFVAGDWVGPNGLLADASLASAELAAKLASCEELAKAA